jgi:hypothetical protein
MPAASQPRCWHFLFWEEVLISPQEKHGERMLGKVVNCTGFIIADADSRPRRFTFRIQPDEPFPAIGSIVTFTPEIAEGKKYGRATEVVEAIATKDLKK